MRLRALGPAHKSQALLERGGARVGQSHDPRLFILLDPALLEEALADGGPRAPPEILVLPNAWDAMSARVFESCGFRAVATTSAGIAYALGYPDGERLTRDEMAEATARVARAIEAPVSADVEAG